MSKPNCYQCQYRGEVPGDTHSKCVHPVFEKIVDSSLGQLSSLMGKRAGSMQLEAGGCKVVGDKHGIKQGWFNHPFNFDPIWLVSCEGFKPKDK